MEIAAKPALGQADTEPPEPTLLDSLFLQGAQASATKKPEQADDTIFMRTLCTAPFRTKTWIHSSKRAG
jgi:hypothetical protein